MKFKLLEKSKFYTDGVKTIKINDGENPPEGFRPGRTFNSNPWNKGLTSDDERVKSYIDKSVSTRKENGYNPWNKGLTKETDDRMAQVSAKTSASSKGRTPWNKGVPASDEQKKKQSDAMRGREPWNKGLTKETNASLMSTSLKLKNHICFVKDWEKAKQKEYETKKRNHSFNSSKPEEELIAKLRSEYGNDDVVAPYRDSRYPFNCDVYIKSIDLFIEYNGTVEHNGRPYDPNNSDDVKEAKYILDKANSIGGQNRYYNIYKWWTEIDPLKLKTFRKNNLNFRIIYPNGLIIEK